MPSRLVKGVVAGAGTGIFKAGLAWSADTARVVSMVNATAKTRLFKARVGSRRELTARNA